MSSDNLYQRIMDTAREQTLAVQFIPVSRPRFDFNQYYQTHKDKIAKCEAWALYSEHGVELTRKALDIGFAEWGKVDIEAPPDATISVPPDVLNQVGYKDGDTIDELTLFLELNDQPGINIYLAKPALRQLSKKDRNKIIARFKNLSDGPSEDGY